MPNDLEGGNTGEGNTEAPPAPRVPDDVAALVEARVTPNTPPPVAEPPAPPARSGNAPPKEPVARDTVDVASPWWWWVALGLVLVGAAVIVYDAVRNREATD